MSGHCPKCGALRGCRKHGVAGPALRASPPPVDEQDARDLIAWVLRSAGPRARGSLMANCAGLGSAQLDEWLAGQTALPSPMLARLAAAGAHVADDAGLDPRPLRIDRSQRLLGTTGKPKGRK